MSCTVQIRLCPRTYLQSKCTTFHKKHLSKISRRRSVEAFPFFTTNLSLHTDEQIWNKYDLIELVQDYQGPMPNSPILIDHNSDEHSHKTFLDACSVASFPIQIRDQTAYDHSFYFLMTFLSDHFRYHQNEFTQIN